VVVAPASTVATAEETVESAPQVKTAPVASALAADNGNDPFSALVGSPQKAAQPAPLQSDAWSHFGDRQLATNSLASTVGFAPRSFSASVAEPLTQMPNPLDERRAMLLTGSLPRADNASLDSTMPATDDHSADRISNERLYESVSRYGLGGNRIQVRF